MAASMRRDSSLNDANRVIVLLVTMATALAIMAAIASEMPAARTGNYETGSYAAPGMRLPIV